MKIYYINLDTAEERRTHIEKNLADFANGEPYERIAAIDADYVERHQIEGNIRANEKGCFLSHIKAIETSLENDEPALILEDDAILGVDTVNILRSMLPGLTDIDILFTDLCVPGAVSMLKLFRLRREMDIDSVGIFPTAEIGIAAASGYILLNTDAKRKVLSALKTSQVLDRPYDLELRKLITEGQLTSSFFFPFITSISPHETRSQLRIPGEEIENKVYDTFRKLMFNESERIHPDLPADLARIPDDYYDREATVFAGIWKLILSRKFPVDLI
jgi:GR25 family glycosyltransferase involved in LPS biosynthesis